MLGSDGCGTIIEAGESVDQSMKGRLVSFMRGGWSRYVIKSINELIVYD